MNLKNKQKKIREIIAYTSTIELMIRQIGDDAL